MQKGPGTLTDDFFVLATPLPESVPYVFPDKRENRPDVIRLFASPADAGLECVSFPPEVCGGMAVTPASIIAPQKNVSLCLHIAWCAYAGRLALNDRGMFMPVTLPIMYDTSCGGEVSLRVRPDERGLRLVEMLHELAGLYAWRETARAFPTWSAARQIQAVQRGMDALKDGIQREFKACDQLAIFDPEFMQWHFISAAALRACEQAGCALPDMKNFTRHEGGL